MGMLLLTSLTISAKPKRVIMIALDGISVEGYQKANTPNLDALMAEGAFSLTTRVAMPSVTLPNWTSHLTGSGPEQHGVVNNGWKIDKFVLPAVETDTDGYYPSVFTILKEEMSEIKLLSTITGLIYSILIIRSILMKSLILKKTSTYPTIRKPSILLPGIRINRQSYFYTPSIQTMPDIDINGCHLNIFTPLKKPTFKLANSSMK